MLRRTSTTALVALLGCSSASTRDAGTDAQALMDDAQRPQIDASFDAQGGAEAAASGDAQRAEVAPDPSPGCSAHATTFPVGTTTSQLEHAGTRTFRVHVPPSYDGSSARPLVVMLHGGGGSGRQFEDNSSDMDPIADRERFITVYPDGTGLVRSWNAGGCCAQSVSNDVDDVGFIAALLDLLESQLCVDQRRVFATGMSNGAMLTHRLACELTDRFAAVAPVAGVDMTARCTPARAIPLMHVHGTADEHVPWDGGPGCGPTNVPFTPVPESMERWRARNGCQSATQPGFAQGDGHCSDYQGCRADTSLCAVDGCGHSWPGGQPPADLVACPGNGPQSTTFHASEVIWSFFAAHPRLP